MKLCWIIIVVSILLYLPNIAITESSPDDGYLLDYVAGINANCPVRVDEITKLESAVYVKKNIFFTFTLDRNVSEINVESFANGIRSNVKNLICNEFKMRNLIDQGLVFKYLYKDKSGKYITTVDFKDYDCPITRLNTQGSAESNFKVIRLPKGVSIKLPSNWKILSDNKRITIDSVAESMHDLSGIVKEDSEFPFAANCFNDNGRTIGMVNVRYYPVLDIEQSDAQQANDDEVNYIDSVVKDETSSGAKISGMTVTSWEGTQKKEINGITVFLTEYHRLSRKGTGTFRVRLVRVFYGDRSFTLTVSYLEATSHLMGPISDKIVQSLQISAKT